MNQAVLDRVLKSPRLPSLPTIALDVIDLVQQKDVNIKQIAHTISHDPALSSKILKTVNSSFYGQAHSISTISHAMVVLGLNSVKTLALGFSLFPNLKESGGDGWDSVAFWKRSLCAAAGGRLLAKHVSLVQQEEAFLGGLLQDLGMLAMHQALGDEYHQIVVAAGTDHRKLWKVGERSACKTDHQKIGGAGRLTGTCPRCWSSRSSSTKTSSGAPRRLAAADPLRRVGRPHGGRIRRPIAGRSPGHLLPAWQECFNLSREPAENLLKGINTATLEMRRLFDLPAGEIENPDQILARANEALMQMTLQQQAQTTELEQKNKQLAQQATTDSLTGVANRRRFNEYLAEQFAATSRSPLSVLFLDTDHFKKFNDTYGHQTGDRVLVELAGILQKAAPQEAVVSRYGGEEFAVVHPPTGPPQRHAARRRRRGISSGPPSSPTRARNCFDHREHRRRDVRGASSSPAPEQLVKAAGQGQCTPPSPPAGIVSHLHAKTPSPRSQKVA